MKSTAPTLAHAKTRDQSDLKSTGSNKADLIVRFVSLLEKRQIEDIEVISALLQKKNFSTDFFEYKVVKKTEIRRPINPKFKDGPKQKVIIEDKINVNIDFKTVRQLVWRVLKDPENVLLLQLSRTKGEPLSLPFIFEEVFNKNRQILVTGLTNNVRLQLITKPDLSFETIPSTVEKNHFLKEQLIKRAGRAKGMQSTARELLDFPGLPKKISEKITALATGKKEQFSDEQVINLIILSDLYSRYFPVLQNFQADVMEKRGTVANLSRQFQDFTKNIDTKYLVSKLSSYLGEEGGKSKDNNQVFQFLYQRLQRMTDGKLFVKGKLLDVKSLFLTLRSMICLARSQQDPELWNRCLFFLKPEEGIPQTQPNLKTIISLASKSQERILISHVASSRNLIEIYITNNIHEIIRRGKISLAENLLSGLEAGVVNNTIVPQLHFHLVKNAQESDGLKLFADPKIKFDKLINPLHCVAGALGHLIDNLLRENLRKFLRQDLKNLVKRFGTDFFDIFYEQAVLETGLQISRNQFAKWLEGQKIVNKTGNLGYLANKIETDFDPLLSPQILMGSGESLFPATYSEKNFRKDYVNNRNHFSSFFVKLRQGHRAQNEKSNPVTIFWEFVEQGKYNFRSSSFREHVRDSFLLEELKLIVQDSCVDIHNDLERKAVNDKAILKIPLNCESLLYIGNTFEITAPNKLLKIRLHALPVKSVSELNEISQIFSNNFLERLRQAETPERKGLVKAMKILDEYRKLSLNFNKYLTIKVLDHYINKFMQQQEKRLLSPAQLKYGLKDKEKLLIGSVRDINLGKLLGFDQKLARRKVEIVDSQSFGQMLESILYLKTVKRDLESRVEIISKLLEILSRFSNTLKEGQEWKNYTSMAKRVFKLLSLPIETLDEKNIKFLSQVSQKIHKLVSKREYKDSVIAILHAEWKRKNPDQAKKIYFYMPFIDIEVAGNLNKLQEIRRAGDLLRMLKRKKCIIFFPNSSKEIQIKQMIEVGNFLKQQSLDIAVYMETRILEKEKLNELSKFFYPNNFFQLDKMNPDGPAGSVQAVNS